jgi:hypothetical protein
MGAYDCDCINNLEYDRRERKAQPSKEGTTKGATSDLISRMETVEHLRRVLDATVPITDYDEGYVDGVEFGISTVSTMPTIQPEPHEGHWIRTDCGLDVECKCSKCGYRDFVEPRDEYWFKRNYCPSCGARMKGERQK